MEGTSTYQAFPASFRRQYGSNLTFVANYTRSKAIDDASGIYNFSQPSGLNVGQYPQQFLGLNKGLSEFDRPNDFCRRYSLPARAIIAYAILKSARCSPRITVCPYISGKRMRTRP